jgi:magnesium-transporting ATPase (P-type)
VDTCCFDKTETLTSDDMQLRGVRLFGSNSGLMDPKEEKIPGNVQPLLRLNGAKGGVSMQLC